MAQVDYIDPIEGLHGKLNKEDDVYFRMMHGKKVGVRMSHPRTEKDFSEHEKAYRKSFGELNKEASRINHDEALAAAYNDCEEQGYQSRYRYILARLIREKAVGGDDIAD